VTTSSAPKQQGLEKRMRFRLYIAGDAPNSAAAALALRAAVAQSTAVIEVEIIDVLQEPQRGLQDGVLVTPMLVRTEPQPERRILGNLSDRATLFAMLGIDRAEHA
jgi:circadian clock protein KaiB